MAQITTIVPTYQRPRLLRRALESIRNQTYSDWIACVYDNASGDETEQVVRRIAYFDRRIRYHRRPRNLGVVRNIDFAMRDVATPFFNILSDDDLIFPTFFERAITALDANPAAILFAGATIQTELNGSITSVPLANWRNGTYSPPEGLFEILKNEHPDVTGTLFRKEVVTELGGLDLGLGIKGDLELFCRCAAQRTILSSATPCGLLFVHPGSIGMITAERNQYKGDAVSGIWLEIAARIAENDRLSADDRETARRMIMGRVRVLLLLRACKATTAGRASEVAEIFTTTKRYFGNSFESSAVRALQVIAKMPMGSQLNCLVDIIRQLRRGRVRLARHKRAEYDEAIGMLLASVASPNV